MPISKKRRAIAVLHLPRKVPEVVALAASVVKAIKSSRHFPNPSPPLADLRNAIDELQLAHARTRLRTPGAVDSRNERLGILDALLGLLRAHVQGIADLDPPRGRAIIRSAGFGLRKAQKRKRACFRARPGAEPGTVIVVAPAAAKRASYDWEYSLDRGRTWKALPSTLQARTSLSFLPAQSVVELRYRAITQAGQGAWSGPIAIFVA
jgi:hypothetical protein